jgi:hypothetical protein
MQYMLLIYNDEKAWHRMLETERESIFGEYFALTDELRREGRYIAGAPLQATSTASTVRIRGGDQLGERKPAPASSFKTLAPLARSSQSPYGFRRAVST